MGPEEFQKLPHLHLLSKNFVSYNIFPAASFKPTHNKNELFNFHTYIITHEAHTYL